MTEPEASYEVVNIPIEELATDPFQPRKTFKESAIRELAASIERYGVLQPLLVRPLMGAGGSARYCIVAGERRYRAAQVVGLRSLPCHIRPYLTTAAAIVALTENVHRVDLSEVEKAESLFRIKTLTDQTWEQVAELVELSTDYVKRLAGLLKLEESVKQWVREGRLSTRVAIALRPLSPRKQVEMAERAIREGLTAEQIREETRRSAPPKPERLPTARLASVFPTLAAPPDSGVEPPVKELQALQEFSSAVDVMDRWIETREWTPVRLDEKQQRALQELRLRVSMLYHHLLALSPPTRGEDPDA